MRPRAALVRSALAVCMAIASPALAQSAAPAGAADLRQQGERAMAARRYDEALQDFVASYARLPDAELLYEQSRALQALGRYPEALEALSRFQVEAPLALRGRVVGVTALMMELRAHVATLELRCEVEGARVVVGDRAIGSTPLGDAVRVNAGRTVVTVTREGYVPFRKEVDLRGGDVTWLEVTLQKSVREGTLRVDVPGNGALMSVDGRPVGVTPVDLSLPAGPHEIELHREGSSDVHTSVVIVAGQKKELSKDLGSTIHVGTWWIWTGLGLAVVGGTVLGYALTTERAHGMGSHFTPGVTSEPLVRF